MPEITTVRFARRQWFRRRIVLTRLAILLAIAVLLELTARLGWVTKLVLVPVTSMLTEVVKMLGNSGVWTDVGLTVWRIAASFVASAIVGIFVGYVLWQRPHVYRLLSPYLGSYYAMPIFAFYPVLIAIFGLSSLPMILIGFAYAVISVIDSVVTGFRNIPIAFHKMVKIYELSRFEATWRVYIPTAASTVFGGLKLAASYSTAAVIASEFLLSADGLGRRVIFSFESFDLKGMYATVILFLIFLIGIVAGLNAIERRIKGWRNTG
jgi:NitT/TauT family transport system permease protein